MLAFLGAFAIQMVFKYYHLASKLPWKACAGTGRNAAKQTNDILKRLNTTLFFGFVSFTCNVKAIHSFTIAFNRLS